MSQTQKKTLKDINLKGKRVIMRCDFNVPQDKESGAITDDKRIRAALPSIQYALEQGAAVILLSHLGRPKKGPEDKFSLAPVAKRLSELLGQEVTLAEDIIGPDAEAKAKALQAGQVLLLENIRFHKEETANDPDFARKLSEYADIYVNDAFGTAHRAHASTAGLAHFLPAVAGFLMEKEIDVMGGTLANPKKPFVAILGGAKVSDKIGVIRNLLKKADRLIIGGGMAYTFLAAKGYEIGTSLCEQDKIDLAKELMQAAQDAGVDLLLPVDTKVAAEFSKDAQADLVAADAIPADKMGLDIGPETAALFAKAIADAKTVVWNGPMGVFEFPQFAEGTKKVAEAIAESSAVSIIGGGDSASAIQKLGFADKVTHISTGGGASLELMEGRVLPGLDCLQDKQARRRFVAGNWKMNLGTPKQAEKLITGLQERLADCPHRIAVAPPFTATAKATELCQYTNIHVAAQNCYHEDKGAYTGEVSAHMLAQMHLDYVILGHSERRQIFHESDEVVNEKVCAGINWGLEVILCCGESLEQREAGETFAHIEKQLRADLKGVCELGIKHVTIAYEPIWAIGTGKTASVQDAGEVCAFIRKLIAELYNQEIADEITILYGGSVKANNAKELFAHPDIDGGLIGGASLKVDDFVAICEA